MKPLFFAFLALLLFVAFGLPLNATPSAASPTGDPAWYSLGPDGGYVYHISVSPHDPALLFARTRAGIHRTTDGGATWELVKDWYSALGRAPVAIDPTTPGHLLVPYFTTSEYSLLESFDNGETWNPRLAVYNAEALIFHPTVAGTIYLFTQTEGDYRTTNGGATWEPLILPGNTTIVSLLPHPTQPDTLYATDSFNTYISTNGGNSWTLQSSTLQDLTIALLDTSTNTLYSYDSPFNTGDTIYRSTDHGVTWELFASGLPPAADFPRIDALVQDPNDPTRLFALIAVNTPASNRVYRTTGASPAWEVTTTNLPQNGDPNGNDLAIAATQPTTLWYGGGGILRSTDNATSWSGAQNGMAAQFMLDIAVDPAEPRRLYAVEWNRLHRSTDAGSNWVNAPVFAANSEIQALEIAPSNPDILFVGTASVGVYRSTDKGITWEPASTGLPLNYVYDFSFHPTDANIVLALLDSGEIYRTTNGGDLWTLVHNDIEGLYDVLFDPSNPQIAWAAGSDVLLKSTNGGASFAPLNPTGLPGTYLIHVIAVHPTNSDILYIGTRGGAFVYRSTNGGTSWTPLNTGVVGSLRTFDLWIDPATPTTLYAAINSVNASGFIQTPLGIRRSVDGGDTWQAYNNGLTYPAVTHLEGAGSQLFANTFGGSIWAIGDVPVVPTSTPTNTPTVTPTGSPTNTPTPSATPTITPTTLPPTVTPTASATEIPLTPTPTYTPSVTITPGGPTLTPTTSPAPSATPTHPPTVTATSGVPTHTPTPLTPTVTVTRTTTTTPSTPHKLYLPLIQK